jgi:hypothetical protein
MEPKEHYEYLRGQGCDKFYAQEMSGYYDSEEDEEEEEEESE